MTAPQPPQGPGSGLRRSGIAVRAYMYGAMERHRDADTHDIDPLALAKDAAAHFAAASGPVLSDEQYLDWAAQIARQDAAAWRGIISQTVRGLINTLDSDAF